MGLDIDSGFPLPMVLGVKPRKLNHNKVKTLVVTGSYFTLDTTVEIPGLVINTTNVLSDHEIEIEVVSDTTDAIYDLEVTNVTGTTTLEDSVEVQLSTWVDLRDQGESFSTGDIRVRAGMTVVRDTEGMYFTGVSNWQSWVKFESLQWNRGENKTLQWILTAPSGSMMIGIGSTNTNEASGSQYQEAEVEAYFSGSTNFWGLYGNSGTPGSAGNQGDGVTISNSGIYKIKFEGDGGVGSTFTLYQLPSSDPGDWDDESNILKVMTVGNTLNPDEPVIMPFMTPQSGGTQRFLALKLE